MPPPLLGDGVSQRAGEGVELLSSLPLRQMSSWSPLFSVNRFDPSLLGREIADGQGKPFRTLVGNDDDELSGSPPAGYTGGVDTEKVVSGRQGCIC